MHASNGKMRFLLVALAAIQLSLAAADLTDNQVQVEGGASADDFAQHPQSRVHRQRLEVRSCARCASNQCQVMGMQRFSEPRCEPVGGPGAACRPLQPEPENKTLHLPNAILHCDNVHMQFCPCAPGLVCDHVRTECVVPADGARASGDNDNKENANEQIGWNLRRGEIEFEDNLTSGEEDERLPLSFGPMVDIGRVPSDGGRAPRVAHLPWGVARFE